MNKVGRMLQGYLFQGGKSCLGIRLFLSKIKGVKDTYVNGITNCFKFNYYWY